MVKSSNGHDKDVFNIFRLFRLQGAGRQTTHDSAVEWQQLSPAGEDDRLRLIIDDFNATSRESFCAPEGHDYQLWRAGKLVPLMITTLLDRGRHTGPGVDRACNTKEPDVDLWEVGVRYPRWDQTVALAELVGVRVRTLAHPEGRPRHHSKRPRRRMGPGFAILSFEPSAVEKSTAHAPHVIPHPDQNP